MIDGVSEMKAVPRVLTPSTAKPWGDGGCSSTVEQLLGEEKVWVRFPSPTPPHGLFLGLQKGASMSALVGASVVEWRHSEL